MSDKIDREIEEILKRIDESGPRENTPGGTQDPSHSWTANLHRTTVSHWPRRAVVASLVLTALIAAGLFFGPIDLSFGTSQSSDSEISRQAVDDQMGQGVNAGDAEMEDSTDEGAGAEEGEHGTDHANAQHEEHDHEGGEHR